MSTVCPEIVDLAAYTLGTLPTNRCEEIDSHVEQCAECQSELETFSSADDTFLSRLRGPESSDEFLDEPECADVMARVAAIGREPSFVSDRQHAEISADACDLDDIGPYRVLSKIGSGGMGTVYKALHTELEKVVALKVLPADRMKDERAVARFKREIKAVGKLDDPNIVRATDAGQVGDTHFLVMEYVDGLDLSDLVSRVGPLPVADACELVRQAATGLEHAHQHGLVHRDIKPSNVMLTRTGQVKVLDLGLALLAELHSDARADLTGSGQMMGTLDYMAPEQGDDSHEVDIRADIYSLGATLYKLLAGHAPLADEKYDTPLKKMRALATQPIPPLRDIRPDVPKQLAALVHQMLDHDPDERPATPRAVAAALAPFVTGHDLPKAIAAAPAQVPSVNEQGKKQTFDYLSSAFTDTARSHRVEEQPLVEPAVYGHRSRVSRRVVVALLLLFVGGGIATSQIVTFVNQRKQAKARAAADEKKPESGKKKQAARPASRPPKKPATKIPPAILKGKDVVTVELPGKYAAFTFGGGGRYLIFRFDTLSKIGIMDLTTGKIVREIDGISTGDLIAANATHLFIVIPGKMLIQRWSLKKLERDRMVRIEGDETPYHVVAGAAGNGPLLIVGKESRLFDPDTLKMIEVAGDGVIGGGEKYATCVSADGLVFGGIPTGYGPVAHSVMKVDGDRTVVHKLGGTSNAVRWAQPTADGHVVFTPTAGIYDALGRKISANWLDGRLVVPTFDPRYFVALRYVDDNSNVALEVGTTADRRIIYSETGFKELVAQRVSSWHGILGATKLGREPRFQWLVDQNMLVTIPSTNDRVTFRKWDVPSLVKKSGEDFLWIASLPPFTVYKGEKFRYQVRVVSRERKLKYRLVEGPDGMRVLSNGQVQWDMPDPFTDEHVPVIITVTDSAGNELIHSFDLKVTSKVKYIKSK